MEAVLKEHSVSDTKENLSALLAKLEANKMPFLISRYGKPVAVVSSYESDLSVHPKLKGSLGAFADPKLRAQEKQAWAKAVVKNENFA